MIYGWTVEYCLNLPAKTFFSMRKAGHSVRKQFITPILAELVHIAQVPNLKPQSVEKLHQMYLREASGVKIPKRGSRREGMDPMDQHTKNILISHFTMAKRLRGLA